VLRSDLFDANFFRVRRSRRRASVARKVLRPQSAREARNAKSERATANPAALRHATTKPAAVGIIRGLL
jgi:hypothetical protein